MAASRVKSATSSPLTLTDPGVPFNLIVIDWIAACIDDDATPTPLIVGANGVTLAREPGPGTASTSRSSFLSFDGGMPCWNAADTGLPAITVTVTATCTGGTNTSIVCGYHYENPAGRKD
jgi:hypothetical protein